ncbi:unnamed protein product [Rodentolepis nana]|uniref:Secreted protein n=1 Tax=Rodentolepis nana TaxID=102285 RepID=A0A0R3THT8_RODNA|nr:unnamed protein product [Rodentolepis nana]
MSESATVHCFSVVRALSSLNLEVWKAGYVGECHCPLFLLYVGRVPLSTVSHLLYRRVPLSTVSDSWPSRVCRRVPLSTISPSYIEECHCPLFLILG